VYPHSLSYFNELAGGPKNGHAHLIDNNIDWGQDLFALRDWLDAHPDTAPVRIACQAFVPLEILGIERGTIPDSPQPGWYVISRHDRHGRSGGYEYFDRLKPVDSIGGSMDVYHITPEQAETVRR